MSDDKARAEGFFRTWGNSVHKHDMLVQLLQEVRAERDAELRRAMAVVSRCVGHVQRTDDAGALRAVLRENGFLP